MAITNLPPEIIVNILSRLPIRTIVTSKCVCKPWLDLIETPEFAKSHLPKSVTGLVVYQLEIRSDFFEIFDFEEAVEELNYNRITEICPEVLFSPFQYDLRIWGSANGLLLFRDVSAKTNTVYICNPITRESIHLPPSLERITKYHTMVAFGFGVSKMSGEYKVVNVYHQRILPSTPVSECRVYTLGTATWRSIVPPDDIFCYNRCSGVFLNGNLHWLAKDLKGSCPISCLNLETEIFSSFSTPLVPERMQFLGGIVVFGECLCLCDNVTWDDEIVIWVMKEYGVETSWTKEFVICKSPHLAAELDEVVYPLKVLSDGDILMWGVNSHLFYYSNKTKTTTKLKMFQLRSSGRIQAMLHRSSFVSLKDFVLENVSMF